LIGFPLRSPDGVFFRPLANPSRSSSNMRAQLSGAARPTGNVTGLSATAAEAAAKSLELIAEVKPGARRVGVLGNADDPFIKPFFEQIERGGGRVIEAQACHSP
jgi:ABC-type uncharacterized transport system substrate-binding protein